MAVMQGGMAIDVQCFSVGAAGQGAKAQQPGFCCPNFHIGREAGIAARKRRALGIMAATLSQPDQWMNPSC